MRIVWRVSPEPTGAYRSFERRAWPMAYFGSPNGPVAAQIICDDEYDPPRVKSGNHRELRIGIVDHSVQPWQWRWLKKRAATLQEAKALVTAFYSKHEEMLPNENEA